MNRFLSSRRRTTGAADNGSTVTAADNSNTGTVGSLEYYKKFQYVVEKGVSESDKKLAAKQRETDDERILELALIMDCTSSMSPWINMCKDTLKQCISDTILNYPELDVRVAFVAYRDFCDGDDIFYVHDFTFDLDHIKHVIENTSAKGGGDCPEDVQGGLRMGLDLSWRKNSVKLAYLVADAPAHGSKYYQNQHDDYPNGNPAGLNLEDMIREYSDREIDFSCYKLQDVTEVMFAVMEKEYNKGKSKGDFQFVDLRREVKEARKDGLSGGLGFSSPEMISSYATGTTEDMSSRYQKQALRKGWL